MSNDTGFSIIIKPKIIFGLTRLLKPVNFRLLFGVPSAIHSEYTDGKITNQALCSTASEIFRRIQPPVCVCRVDECSESDSESETDSLRF